ncbi:MAG TPA: hypothetical protein PK393_11330, partial [Synergistaceae bacterium]|nr:hypothetical protein [Synergistaceae bacterium]
HIFIDDDGAGLATEQRDAVIQRGVRADEQVPGSGLGLAIVDDLARLYGGERSEELRQQKRSLGEILAPF